MIPTYSLTQVQSIFSGFDFVDGSLEGMASWFGGFVEPLENLREPE